VRRTSNIIGAQKKVEERPMSTLYLDASKVLEKIIKHKTGVKDAVYSSRCPPKQKPAILGLVSKTVANLNLLNEALNNVGAFKKEAGMRWAVVLAMATDLLLDSGEIRGGGQVKKFLMEHEKTLKETIEKRGGIKVFTKKPDGNKLPRYVRVNVARWKSVDAAIEALREAGIETVEKDPHVPHLLVLESASTKTLVTLPSVDTGDLLLQDKSTCVSAYALLHDRPKGGKPIHVMDVCAAPGGKTLHILEMLRAGDSLTAVEKDPKRAAILERRLATLGGQRKGITITTIVGDFLELLQTDPQIAALPPVTHINLDPSCSGSGMEGPKTKGDKEVGKLASFQKMMLKHAQNEFDKCRVVCYSTCSVIGTENEEVVETTIEKTKFKLVQNPLPKWWPFCDESGYIRTSPEISKCRGFFLAKLVRK
jgi:25S rRNA (cytosine2278-C5)-methyltransferase